MTDDRERSTSAELTLWYVHLGDEVRSAADRLVVVGSAEYQRLRQAQEAMIRQLPQCRFVANASAGTPSGQKKMRLLSMWPMRPGTRFGTTQPTTTVRNR